LARKVQKGIRKEMSKTLGGMYLFVLIARYF